jgi:DEAD/DEAH box helicase domain-containing protein
LTSQLKNIIVFDCETKTTIMRGDGFKNLEISVSVAYHYESRQFQVFLEHEQAALCKLVREADLVVGFNQLGFDMPLLRNYDPEIPIDVSKHYDILREFEKVAGHRIKLDHVLNQTLGTKKTSDGLQAVEWYKRGEIQKIAEYCKEDVRQTRNLFDYIVQHKSVAFQDKSGKKKWVPVTPPEIFKVARGENLRLF